MSTATGRSLEYLFGMMSPLMAVGRRCPAHCIDPAVGHSGGRAASNYGVVKDQPLGDYRTLQFL